MTNRDDMPTRFPALAWAVIFTILLVAAVAKFALVLILTSHNRPRQALARHSNSRVGDAGRAISYYSAQIGGPLSGTNWKTFVPSEPYRF